MIKQLLLFGCLMLSQQWLGAQSSEGGKFLADRRDVVPDTIPFVLTDYNNVKVKAVLNGLDTLQLKFDSGTTGLLLTHEAIAAKTGLLAAGPDKNTEDYVRLQTPAQLQISNLGWDSMYVYPVTHSGQGTDGRFGWDLFSGRVLELNYDENILVVHSTLPAQARDYTKLKIVAAKTLFCVEGALEVDGVRYPNRFLFDNGYQRAMLLDSVLMEEQHFPKDLPVLKVNRLRNGAGKVFITKVVNCEKLLLDELALQNIPTQLLNTANPAGFKTHILGNELLKRFNTYFDFIENNVYLMPNSLWDLAYTDATK